jgi:serine/threonine-protein kinase
MKPEPPDAKPEPPATKPEPPATKPEPSATKPEPSATKPEPSATKPEPSATKPARGRLSVHVDPFADVWIDGRFVKTTPIENMSLSVGRHRVRLVNEPGERDETVTITIDPAKPILIEKNW